MAFQGYNRLRWGQSLRQNYFLWRDRKGGLVSATCLLTVACLLQLGALWIYERCASDPWHFLGIFASSQLLMGLLLANVVLLVNRVAQRAVFVAMAYGHRQGMCSIARLIWSLVVSVCAWGHATWCFVADRDTRKWIRDKSQHIFPEQNIPGRKSTPPIGQILISQGVLTPAQLEDGMSRRINGIRLGGSMMRQGTITPLQLATALAYQAGVQAEDIDCRKLDSRMIALLPSRVALHYAILPLRIEDGHLILARESPLDQVSLSAMARKIDMPVRYVIVPPGQVVSGGGR